MQQAKKVPELIEQLRAEAPARIEAVKNTDPKAVQEALTAKVAEVFGAIDPKKLGETAQDLALRGVGVAAEYAVRAKETYDKVAEHGEQAVRTWRGEFSEEIVDIAVAVEPGPEAAEPAADPEPVAEAAGEEKPVAKKSTARRTSAKKAAVTADDAS